MLLVSHANKKKEKINPKHPPCGFVPARNSVCVRVRACVSTLPATQQPSLPLLCEATLAGSSGGNVYADHNTHKHTHSNKQTLSAPGRWFGLWLVSSSRPPSPLTPLPLLSSPLLPLPSFGRSVYLAIYLSICAYVSLLSTN